VQAVLAEIVSGDISVVGDMQIALQAAFANGPGVIVIAGTGSIAYGRTESGELARAGGWGFAVSDEGSGYWIGRRAVAFALRDCDQRGCWESELLSELMKAFRVHTHEEFILKVNGNPPPNFAQLAPVVIGLAERDDRVAMEVCSTAADELSELALLVLRKLFSNEERVQVGISGGVFAHSALVRHAFCNHLGRKFPVAAVNPSIVEPALGALELARQRFAAEMSRS
jgi:N-acetylglucosamine kinase-like BadF-type ATPase